MKSACTPFIGAQIILALSIPWTISATPAIDSMPKDETIPVASIRQGKLSGKTMKSNMGKEFSAFLGIPYGKVAMRFTKPEPAESWTGVRDATKDGPPCSQVTNTENNISKEDCLNLNVYTHKNFSSSALRTLLPVLAYIHGGGFVMGDARSTSYGPGRYMDGKPIVLILFNYRVGSFGFLSTNDDAAPGNFGLLDQVMALEWIKENVEAFGGDPNRVTIVGNSAGAVSVTFHLLSPLSKGLFHGAIAQSGSALCPWALQTNPLENTQKIAKKVNCPTENTAAMVACLRKVDTDDLITASDMSTVPGWYSMTTVPVIEKPHEGSFLTESPYKLLKEGKFNKVPVMSGVTADEMSMFFAQIYMTKQGRNFPGNCHKKSWKEITLRLFDLFDHYNFTNETFIDAISEKYFKDVDCNNTRETRVREIQLLTDLMFNSCNDETVKILSASGVPVFMYVFDYGAYEISASNFTGKPDVGHTTELFLLFNKNSAMPLTYTDETENVSKTMVDLWTNFVTTGNPTPLGSSQWSPATPGHMKYLRISDDFKMEEAYLANKMEFWKNILYNN